MLKEIDLEKIVAITKEAGEAIMQIYNKDFQVEYKDDKSPLTEADTKANEIICTSLVELYPNIPILSEENKKIPYAQRKNWEYFWCIDPIDGTKEFINKNGEFTINIALIHRNTPVLGVVYAPAIGELYKAKKGEGVYKLVFSGQSLVISEEKLPISCNRDGLVVVASKSHLTPETQDFIDQLTTKNQRLTTISKGSSLKLCMVAEGIADIYPRLAPTMEWDTAAADAIIRESGKIVYNYETKKSLEYNKKDLLNPWFIVR